MPSYGLRKRNCADKDPALERIPTAGDSGLDSLLKLDTALEREDVCLHLAMVHTAHQHLVVSEVQTPGDRCEVPLAEHATEHKDVARVLALDGDGSGHMLRSVGLDVLNAVFYELWHFLLVN